MTAADLSRLLSPLARRLRLLVSRAVVTLVHDAARMQGLQLTLLAGETADHVERFQEYGFTSHPQPGAEAIAAAIGGARGHLVAIAVDDRRYRLTSLQPGEVALYTDEGDAIKLSRGRIIEVTAGAEVKVTAGTKVTIAAPATEITGTLTVGGQIIGRGGMAVSGGSGVAVDGDLSTTGDVTAAGTSLDHHQHTGDSGGTTSEPI